MTLLTVRARDSRWRQAWGVVSDLLIVTALLWALPLLLGAIAALVSVLSGTT